MIPEIHSANSYKTWPSLLRFYTIKSGKKKLVIVMYDLKTVILTVNQFLVYTIPSKKKKKKTKKSLDFCTTAGAGLGKNVFGVLVGLTE